MTQTLSATEAKNRFGALINRVKAGDYSVIIENRGAPAAAIISIAEYERLQELKEKARREEALAELRKIRAELEQHQKDMSLEDANALVEEINRDIVQRLIDKGKIRYED